MVKGPFFGNSIPPKLGVEGFLEQEAKLEEAAGLGGLESALPG